MLASVGKGGNSELRCSRARQSWQMPPMCDRGSNPSERRSCPKISRRHSHGRIKRKWGNSAEGGQWEATSLAELGRASPAEVTRKKQKPW